MEAQKAAEHGKINQAIRWAAARLGWGEGKLWSYHSLKHGRCTDLRLVHGMSLEQVGDYARLRSKAMCRLYAGHADEAN